MRQIGAAALAPRQRVRGRALRLRRRRIESQRLVQRADQRMQLRQRVGRSLAVAARAKSRSVGVGSVCGVSRR